MASLVSSPLTKGVIGLKSPWWLALLATAVFMTFSATVLPWQAQKASAYSETVGSADSSFFYSAAELESMAEAYGQEGRDSYIYARWTFDLAWPAVYLLFLSTTIGWFARHSNFSSLVQEALVAMIWWGTLLDLVENLGATTVMATYPESVGILAWIAPLATPVKWALVGGSMGALVVAMVGAIVAFIQKKRARG